MRGETDGPAVHTRSGVGWAAPGTKKRRYVRRITLYRPGEKDVILVTSLCDGEALPAADVLEIYLKRWGIERIFQQVTEVFGLSAPDRRARRRERSFNSRCVCCCTT